ncbi:MAG: CrcB family protein [Opitutaceae bacterium]|nr:CrcB family protein [Opitutaceae bacterium]
MAYNRRVAFGLMLLLTFAGSALGGLARHLLGGWVDRRTGGGFPFGTLAVNVSGALVIGLVAGVQWEAVGDPALVRQFLMYGLLGGYTTVSTFSLNTLNLLQTGAWSRAAANIAGSFFLCLGAVRLGLALAGGAVP